MYSYTYLDCEKDSYICIFIIRIVYVFLENVEKKLNLNLCCLPTTNMNYKNTIWSAKIHINYMYV